MFFELSKTLGYFALPSTALMLFALLGVVLTATRYARLGRHIAAAGIVLLAIFGLLPVGNALLWMLEQRFPPWDEARGAPDGIIVLGGAIDAERSAAAGKPVLGNSYERVTLSAELAQRYPQARLVFTGGSGLLLGGAAEAGYAAAAYERLGVPRERLLLESRSRNTAENATFSAALVTPKAGERWVLVTSASHMPRAVGAFRRAGVPVEAYPVDRVVLPGDLVSLPGSLSMGLGRTDTALREWIGLVIYRLVGRTSELFPGP